MTKTDYHSKAQSLIKALFVQIGAQTYFQTTMTNLKAIRRLVQTLRAITAKVCM